MSIWTPLGADINGGLSKSAADSYYDPAGAAALRAPKLIATDLKAADYTSAPGDFARFDCTANRVNTLPNAPADVTRVGARIDVLGASMTLMLTAQGIDTFQGGGTTLVLSMAGESVQLTYRASEHLWVITEHGYSKASLNSAYLPPTYTLATLPAATGSKQVAWVSDQSGGTLNQDQMVGGVPTWVSLAPGVTQAGGIIAGPAQMSSSFDVKAVGTGQTDVTGMSLSVPASSRGVLLRAVLQTQANSGTAANASLLQAHAYITDASNNVLAEDSSTFVQVGSSALVFQDKLVLEAYLTAPVAAATYKIRAQLGAAAPANWTSAFLLPAHGAGGGVPKDNFYALAA